VDDAAHAEQQEEEEEEELVDDAAHAVRLPTKKNIEPREEQEELVDAAHHAVRFLTKNTDGGLRQSGWSYLLLWGSRYYYFDGIVLALHEEGLVCVGGDDEL